MMQAAILTVTHWPRPAAGHGCTESRWLPAAGAHVPRSRTEAGPSLAARTELVPVPLARHESDFRVT